MKKLRVVLIAALLAFAMIFAAACGGNGGNVERDTENFDKVVAALEELGLGLPELPGGMELPIMPEVEGVRAFFHFSLTQSPEYLYVYQMMNRDNFNLIRDNMVSLANMLADTGMVDEVRVYTNGWIVWMGNSHLTQLVYDLIGGTRIPLS